MERLIYWSGQYLLAAGTMFALLVAVDVLLRGEALDTGWRESLAWSVVASAIFIGSRYYRASRGATCAMCSHPDAKT